MKKYLFIFFILFFVSCTKDNTTSGTEEEPDEPESVEYKSVITINFVIPDNVTLLGTDDIWILDSNNNYITKRLETTYPVTTAVLVGDTVKKYLHKKCYVRCELSKLMYGHNYIYMDQAPFIMKDSVSVTFYPSSETVNEYYP
ncbi:hypothetical protein JXE04_01980 [Patescibacteria group bacterium]|nr:hypothetical protein [Patescibacteria group bacterium]